MSMILIKKYLQIAQTNNFKGFEIIPYYPWVEKKTCGVVIYLPVAVARWGGGGGYSPPHWPADQNAK